MRSIVRATAVILLHMRLLTSSRILYPQLRYNAFSFIATRIIEMIVVGIVQVLHRARHANEIQCDTGINITRTVQRNDGGVSQ